MIEALAAGLPVVATDVAACRELLGGGVYGRLIPRGSPELLATAIIEALTTGSGGTDQMVTYAMSFTPERMMDSYLQIARG
jgi:glycosyltransferase involved in cell wall biosynthesis